MILLAQGKLYLPDGKLTIFSPGYYFTYNPNFDVNWFSQGFIRSVHAIAIFSPFDNANSQVSVYSGEPDEMPKDATRAFSIPIKLESECLQFDCDAEDYYGELGIPLEPANYMLTVFQFTDRGSGGDNTPDLKFEIFIQPCNSQEMKGETLIADELLKGRGVEFAEVQPENYSDRYVD
ncbi:MAG: hypothetical protein K2X77_16730 [Candidatus Obscuribacterales bacterium]|nr:hypothetical protein [Candidatus Obscuribacterales bacterium]